LASPREKAALEKIVSELPVPREDPAYSALFNTPVALTRLPQSDVAFLSQEFGSTLGACCRVCLGGYVPVDAHAVSIVGP
jgi:hypothetical protein